MKFSYREIDVFCCCVIHKIRTLSEVKYFITILCTGRMFPVRIYFL